MHIVYIGDVELFPGLRMRYGRVQVLFMNCMAEDEFISKLCRSEVIEAVQEQVTV